MISETVEQLPLQNSLRNGDIISQQQFTQLILEQREATSIDLLTMAYMTPRGDGGSVAKIHRHLLELANRGVKIHVSIDHNYAHLIAPHSDFPRRIAPLFMDRRDLRVEQLKQTTLYSELKNNPNIEVEFQGESELKILPFSRFDHRKVLRVKGSSVQDFAVIYGFNMDDTIDHDVDSGIYLTDPETLTWVDEQVKKDRKAAPERRSYHGLTFVTRELGKEGNELADREIRDVIQGAQKSLLFCSQFLPDGEIFSDLVQAAGRGVDVAIISNGPAPQRQPLYKAVRDIALRKLLRACRNNANLQFYAPNDGSFVHIKALIADIDDPVKARALTGTDNLSNQLSRRFGTREILIALTEYEFISNLYKYIGLNVASNTTLIA